MANRDDKPRPLAVVLDTFADAAGELLAHPDCPVFLVTQLELLKGEGFQAIQSNPETNAERIAAQRGMFRLFLPWC